MKQNAEVSLSLRNGTVDFLLYPRGAGEQGIEVRVQDGTVWLNQAGIAQLYHIDRSVITKHIRQIYESKEQDKQSTCAKIAQVADNGKHNVRAKVELAKAFAEKEYELYRPIQDRLYQSEFDRFLKESEITFNKD